jgi:cytoskeletal protein CcmA (bactofilin family)
MFAKPANSAERPMGSEAARKPLPASLVGANVRLVGELISDGDVQLDGCLQGQARVSRLTLGDSGSVEGSIDGDVVEIRGRVRGQITARSVRLHPTADVEGDITHAEIVIESGARFVGRSLRLEAEAQVPTLNVVTAAE